MTTRLSTILWIAAALAAAIAYLIASDAASATTFTTTTSETRAFAVFDMSSGGVDTFVEVGPGRVLSSLMKRAAPGVTVVSIDGAAALRRPSNV